MTGPNGGSATWLTVDHENPDPVAAVTWNATKVAAALSDTLWNGTGSQAMICLSAFPALWADANASQVLNASFANAWVSLAAELQTLIARLGVRVAYWEVTNEWDQAYAAVGNTSGLADLVLATAAVLRAADPTVKVRSALGDPSGGSLTCLAAPTLQVGGPAWARPDIWQNAGPFIEATLGKLDFYSYHSCEQGHAPLRASPCPPRPPRPRFNGLDNDAKRVDLRGRVRGGHRAANPWVHFVVH